MHTREVSIFASKIHGLDGLPGIEDKEAQTISNMQQSRGDRCPVVKLLYWKIQAFVKVQLDFLRNLGPKK